MKCIFERNKKQVLLIYGVLMGIISLSRLLLSVNKNNIFTINCIAFLLKSPS